MITAFAVDLINTPFMLLFFLIYAILGCVLTLTAFFVRTQTIDLKVSFRDAVKAILLCFFEMCAFTVCHGLCPCNRIYRIYKEKTELRQN